MIRILQGHTNKAQNATYKAAAAMKRGAFVTVNDADKTVELASGATDYLVDIAKNYDGINSIVEPSDGDFEDIPEGALVIAVPVLVGERYATTEVNPTTCSIGDKLVATSGKAAKASEGGDWIYCGEYADPTGKMYIVKKG